MGIILIVIIIIIIIIITKYYYHRRCCHHIMYKQYLLWGILELMIPLFMHQISTQQVAQLKS